MSVDPFADDDVGAPPAAPTTTDYLDEVFGPQGYLAQRFAGYQPRPGQVALTHAVDRAIAEGRHLLAEGPTGCHVAGQGILLFDGTVKPVEEILVGDRLVGPDGRPRLVLALARGEQETVTIRPTKGEPWTVNLDHILSLVRTDKPGRVVDVRVRDWMHWSKRQKHLHKLFRSAAHFQSVPTLLSRAMLDPYLVGVLLGDGTLATDNGVQITKPDPEIRALCEEQAQLWGLRVRSKDSRHHLVGDVGNKRHPILERMRGLGMTPCQSEQRRVPHPYKVASLGERMQVLAGLLDTDGHLSENSVNCYDFISKSRALAEDVTFLARSIGLAAYLSPCRKGYRDDRGNYHAGTYYRVSISGHTSAIPLRIERKRAPKRRQKKDVLHTGFTVELTGKVEPYYGFSLDSDGRYLLDDFTVTHNTGKSIAYAVPAAFHAAKNGRRVVIVTANIALTEQLAQKDLPLLQQILPWGFSFALLKGRSNYLCVDRLLELDAERFKARQQSWDRGSSQMDEQIEAIRAWAETTETGDISELSFVPEAGVWRKFSRSSDECKANKCKQFGNCFAYAAKRAARGADIIVTNYHMLFASILVRRLTNKNILLPGYDVAILDEAHKAAEVARDFFGFEVTPERVRRAARQLAKLKDDARALELERRLRAATQGFFDQLLEYKKRGGYKVRLKEQLADDEILKPYWTNLDQILDQVAYMLRQAATAQPTQDERADWEKASMRAAEVRINLESMMRLEDAENIVYFLAEDRDPSGNARITVGAKPIRVDHIIREELFEAKPAVEPRAKSTYSVEDEDDEPTADEQREAGLRDTRSVIVTSATICVDDSFDYIARELGAPPGSYDTLLAESPFDWPRQALLIVPEGLPDPSLERDAFQRAVPEVLVEAVRLAEGRTLALFTSYKMLGTAHTALKDAKCPFRILKQGEMPRTKLVDEFRRDTQSVLLGTESMWAGVDVAGEALSCVVVDKLPFPTPDDPVLDAIASRDKKWFFNHAVPRAVIQFKQGFGRLIRAVTDVGVVVLCDRRIIDKSYGKAFLRSLPPCQRSRKLEHIAEFLPRAQPAAPPPPPPEPVLDDGYDDDIPF